MRFKMCAKHRVRLTLRKAGRRVSISVTMVSLFEALSQVTLRTYDIRLVSKQSTILGRCLTLCSIPKSLKIAANARAKFKPVCDYQDCLFMKTTCDRLITNLRNLDDIKNNRYRLPFNFKMCGDGYICIVVR